jgi:hypothetical protein
MLAVSSGALAELLITTKQLLIKILQRKKLIFKNMFFLRFRDKQQQKLYVR